MITAELLGGLSNQMFQIATVYSLAINNNDECAFPLDRTEMGQGQPARNYITNIFRHIKELPKGWVPEYRYNEPTLNYVPIPYHKNMQIRGYFPSEKYFIHHKKEIFDLYVDMEVINRLQNKFTSILKNSVSFHIRRGDYLKNPSVISIPPKNYYIRALGLLEKSVAIENILVFSDDIPWCKRNFSDKRITFIEGQEDFEDMYLMSLCLHNINPPSGFSWWGSYLNRNPYKIIYVPELWFGSNGIQGVVDQFTKEMIKI
jgi:hypothetical protein